MSFSTRTSRESMEQHQPSHNITPAEPTLAHVRNYAYHHRAPHSRLDSDGSISTASTMSTECTGALASERRRVLRRRKVGERSSNGGGGGGRYTSDGNASSSTATSASRQNSASMSRNRSDQAMAQHAPVSWRDRLYRLRWSLVLWVPLFVIYHTVYDDTATSVCEGSDQPLGCNTYAVPLVTAALLGTVAELSGVDWLRIGYYVSGFLLGALIGVDYDTFSEYKIARLLSFVAFGIVSGQLRYQWYKHDKQYPSSFLITGALALGEIFGCICTHDQGLIFLLQAGFGYAMIVLAPMLCAVLLSKTMDLIRRFFGSNVRLDMSNYVRLAWWLGSTVCSVGLLLVVGVYFTVWVVPFVFKCQLFFAPYGCALEMASVEARRSPPSSNFHAVGEEHRQHISKVMKDFGGHH
eukprot:PhM_4_TR9520/c0_g1_i1/m.1532